MRTEVLARPFPGAMTNWTYVPSRPRWDIVLRRWRAHLTRIQAPASRVIKRPEGSGKWIIYFMYLPQGALSEQHRFTIEKLIAEAASLMIVCACPAGHPVLNELVLKCDALCWKSLEGYDFSGYYVGMHALARDVPDSDVLVLNDSMLGPFRSLVPFLEQTQWRLTGLSATALEENHLQSFAFIVRKLDLAFLQAVDTVLSPERCYPSAEPVILLQETRLARVASRHMSVGSYWYTDGSKYLDLTLNCPEQLLEAGFPLLKRSLFDKFDQVFQDPAAMRGLLERLGHPPILA